MCSAAAYQEGSSPPTPHPRREDSAPFPPPSQVKEQMLMMSLQQIDVTQD